MANTQVNTLIQQIQAFGFTYNKDALGVYFNNGEYRISVVYHGPGYLNFVNKATPLGWQLLKKSDFFLNYQDALAWVLTEAPNTP